MKNCSEKVPPLARYKLHDSETGKFMEINGTLAYSLIRDQYPDSFGVYIRQLTLGEARCVSVRGGMVEKI